MTGELKNTENTMYKINWKKEIPSFILITILFASAFILYPSLPDQIPLHWNINGEIDRYGSKLFGTFLMPVMTLFIAVLMLYIPFIDPKKRNYEKFKNVYTTIRLSFVLFMSFIYGITMAASLGYPVDISFIVPFAVSLLFILLGNYMGKVRQNWFVGFRFPWTLDNEEVWNKTHRFGGKLMVGAGLIGVISSFLPAPFNFIIFMIGVFGSVVATILYSLSAYNKSKL